MADSIRDALTKAVAESEAKEPLVSEPAIEPAIVEPPVAETPVEAKASDEGDAAKPPVTTGSDPTDSKAPSDAAAASSQAAAGTPPSQGAQATVTDQAPTSWSAEERKHWAALPKEAQAAVRRRETEMRRAISASHEATTHKRNFEQSISRFEPLLKEKGVTDVMSQVINPLLTLRAGLEIGTPEQKAGILASIVRDFSIDIATLDTALTNMANSGGLQPRPRAPAFNPRQVPELAPLFQIAERFQQAETERATAAVAAVASLPHFDELRNTMADIVERGNQEGKKVDVTQAYDRALAFHGMEPRIKPTITNSEAAAQLARARNAASTVSGAPKTSPSKKSVDLRSQLESAWSSANS